MILYPGSDGTHQHNGPTIHDHGPGTMVISHKPETPHHHCDEKEIKLLHEYIDELRAALKPFAAAYEALLDNAPSPDVVLNTKNHDEWGVVSYGKCPAIVRWSDLYRAANLLREKKNG